MSKKNTFKFFVSKALPKVKIGKPYIKKIYVDTKSGPVPKVKANTISFDVNATIPADLYPKLKKQVKKYRLPAELALGAGAGYVGAKTAINKHKNRRKNK